MTDQTQPRTSSPAILHKLSRAHLSGLGGVFPPKTRSPSVCEALAQCGYGLRHYEGEHVVAMLRSSAEGSPFSGLLLTDRVLLVRGGDDKIGLDIEDLTGAQIKRGFLQDMLTIQAGETTHEISAADHGEEVATFLEALAKANYAPGERRVPAAMTTEEDPTGIGHLVGALGAPDDRVVALAELLFDELAARRIDTEAGRDLVVRIHALYRTMAFGRGMRDGVWLSPLRVDDLGHCAANLFDNAETEMRSVRGGVELDVFLSKESRKKAKKPEKLEEKMLGRLIGHMVEKTVGNEVFALFGGDAEALRFDLSEGPDTDELLQSETETETSVWSTFREGTRGIADSLLGRNRRASGGALTAFEVYGRVAGQYLDLTAVRPETVAEWSAKLVPLEVRALVWRVLKGWEPSTASLLGAGDAALKAELDGRVSPAQIRAILAVQ